MAPRVSVYRPQLRVPVLEAPRIQEVDVSSGVLSAANDLEQTANRMRATRLSEARLQAATQLEELQFEAEKQPWESRASFFESGSQRIRSGIEKGLGSDRGMRAAFEDDWGRNYLPRQMEVRHSARKGEIDHHTAVLDESLSTFARQASQASDERLASLVKDQAALTIADSQTSGFISEVEAGNRLREFARTIEKNRVLNIIADPSKGGPNAAVKALSDFNQFVNLREEDRLMLVGRAESKLQHQAAMSEAAANRAERARRIAGDQIAKEGWDLIAKGQMSDDWLTKNRWTLDSSDYKALVNATQSGGGANSGPLIADLYQKLYLDGEDVGPTVIDALRNRTIAPDTAKTLLEENKQTQGTTSPARQGRAFITTYLKPSELNPAVGAPERLANALQEFEDTLRENPRMGAGEVRKLAAGLAKRYSVINRDQITVTLPSPRHMVGERSSFDLQKTKAATAKAYLAKHGGDKAARDRDPEYRRELLNIKKWSEAREAAEAAQRAAEALEKE